MSVGFGVNNDQNYFSDNGIRTRDPLSNDEISGKAVSYDLKNKVYSSPVNFKDGAIEFILPISKDVSAYFKGDSLTFTTLEGNYIDNYVKVK